MPCTYYLPGEEEAILRRDSEKLRTELDKATRELCELREEFLARVNPDQMTWEGKGDLYKRIEQNQIAHRAVDLQRIEKTLKRQRDVARREIRDLESQAKKLGVSETPPRIDTLNRQIKRIEGRLTKTLKADPNLPLAAQLGFDPDSI